MTNIYIIPPDTKIDDIYNVGEESGGNDSLTDARNSYKSLINPRSHTH